jgi:hypothetical protein
MYYTTHSHYCHYFSGSQLDLVADRMWQAKRDEIATTVENLGDGFRPAFTMDGWPT